MYASQQPAGFKNHIQSIAFVGATGQIGSYIATALIDAAQKHKRFTVTALTRDGKSKSLPKGFHAIKQIDYDKAESLVGALKGHDCLVITMAVSAPDDTQDKLIRAAAEAGVSWLVPNDWGYDFTATNLKKSAAYKDCMLAPRKIEAHELVAKLGKSSRISFACGFWFTYSLSAGEGTYGFDFAGRKLTLIGDGTSKLSMSNYEQLGRSVAAALSLPILPDDEAEAKKEAEKPTLSSFRNKTVRTSSYTVSQRDLWAAVQRVTGTKESDWTVTRQDVHERYGASVKRLFAGDRTAMMPALFSAMQYEDEPANFEAAGGTDDKRLGVVEPLSLDESVQKAIKMNEEQYIQKLFKKQFGFDI